MLSEKLAVTGRLAASIAHEINNPLEGVINLLYLMRTESSVDQLRIYVSQAEQELARVSEIVKQTLRFYKEPTNPVKVDIAAVIESVLSLYESRLTASGIRVQVKAPILPVFIFAKAGELRQVLANLIGNSIDAMRLGGCLYIRTSIESSGSLEAKRVRLTVADTGKGIPENIRPLVFEPFVTTKGDTGTGLGLWVSGELAKKNKWRFRLRSRSAQQFHGTVFSLVMAAV